VLLSVRAAQPELDFARTDPKSKWQTDWRMVYDPSEDYTDIIVRGAAGVVPAEHTGKGAARDFSSHANAALLNPDGSPKLGNRAKLSQHYVAPGACPNAPAHHGWPRDFSKFPVVTIVENSGQYKRDLDVMKECGVGCAYTQNGAQYGPIADNWMKFHPGGGHGGPADRCPHVHSTVMTMESIENYGALRNPVAAGFDLTASTMLNSDAPMIYLSWAEYGIMEPLQPKPARGAVFIAAFISNCGASNHRLEYLQEMMKHVQVDSYGACANNKHGGEKGSKGGWFKSKLELLRKYKFTLAFENGNIIDYVSEKLFMPLVAGSVPVVMGAPNAIDYAPSDHSIIETKDFASAKALAEYLKFLDENDDEYQKYLDWKREGLSRKFKAIADWGSLHSHCRLCIRIADVYREQFQQPDWYAAWVRDNLRPGHVVYQIRARGEYEYRAVHLPHPPRLEALIAQSTQMFADRKFKEVYKFTVGDPGRTTVTQNVLDKLPQGSEIEVVLV
jgi:hypothetical protein